LLFGAHGEEGITRVLSRNEVFEAATALAAAAKLMQAASRGDEAETCPDSFLLWKPSAPFGRHSLTDVQVKMVFAFTRHEYSRSSLYCMTVPPFSLSNLARAGGMFRSTVKWGAVTLRRLIADCFSVDSCGFVLAAAFVLGIVGIAESCEPPVVNYTRTMKDGESCLICEVNDRHSKVYLFAIDTGAQTSVLDSEVFKAEAFTGGSIEGTINNSFRQSVPAKFVRPPRLGLGPFELTSPWVPLVDLSLFKSMTGLPISGILGMDFLNDKILEVDFEAKSLRIYQHDRPVKDYKFDRFIRKLPSGSRAIDAQFEDVSASFLLDTGGLGFLKLQPQLYSRLLAKGILKSCAQSTFVFAPGGQSRQERAAEMVWEEICHVPVRGMEVTESSEARVGLEFLRATKFAIDFPNSRLHLTPRLGYPGLMDVETMLGFAVQYENNKVMIRGTLYDKKHPLHAAGAKAGDVIAELSGLSPSEINEVSLYELVKKNAAGSISIKVLNDQKAVFQGMIPVSEIKYAKRK
jgi:hypothetical protein